MRGHARVLQGLIAGTIFCSILLFLHPFATPTNLVFVYKSYTTTPRSQGRLAIRDHDMIARPTVTLEYDDSASLFNAIHGSMRQWGSSLNHNGFTLYPVSVPAGSLFYHGNNNLQAPTGLQWLAFEMEQANSFATSRRRGPPRQDRRPPIEDESLHETTPIDQKSELPKDIDSQVDRHDSGILAASVQTANHNILHKRTRSESPRSGTEALGAEGTQSTPSNIDTRHGGFIHTFRSTRAWKLMYIDGMSAAKSSLGTLDLQHLMIDWDLEDTGPQKEHERALALCAWQNRAGLGLDGFLRMEVDFEVIFCNGSSGANELIRSVRKPVPSESGREMQHWQWLKSAERNYDGIGGARVDVDYSNLVTAYGRSYKHALNMTSGLPRLNQLSPSEIDLLRHDVEKTFANLDGHLPVDNIDWQRRADLTVQRYATKLQSLDHYSAPETRSDTTFDAVLENVLVNFLDYRLDGASRHVAAIKHCTYEFLPVVVHTDTDQQIFTAFETVMTNVCKSLYRLASPDISWTARRELVVRLKSYLRWSDWLRCGKCQEGEMCFLPMWPFGGVEDRTPHCVSMENVSRHHGYWRMQH